MRYVVGYERYASTAGLGRVVLHRSGGEVAVGEAHSVEAGSRTALCGQAVLATSEPQPWPPAIGRRCKWCAELTT